MTDAEEQGAADCQRGHTANPYGTPDARTAWSRGHDNAFDAGLCKLPRFGRLIKKGRR